MDHNTMQILDFMDQSQAKNAGAVPSSRFTSKE